MVIMEVHFQQKLYYLLIGYRNLLWLLYHQWKKKVGQDKKTKKISITFTAAAEGEQNQWKEHTY